MNLVKIVYRVHVIYFCFFVSLGEKLKSDPVNPFNPLRTMYFKLLRITTVSSNPLWPNRLVPSWSFLWSPMLFFHCCCRKLTWSESLATIQIWTSLVVQGLRIRLPVQGAWTPALVWGYPTCHGAAKFMHHNQWAHVWQPPTPTHRAPCSTEREATATSSPSPTTQEEPPRCS